MVILWRIEERCNFACSFCGYSRELPRQRRSTSAADVRRGIERFAAWPRRPGERVLLSWLGGEPFLRRDLTELTRCAVELGLSVSATSNGTALTDRALRRHVIDHYAELTLSVDGFADFHDGVRGHTGSFALVEKVLRALAAERHERGHGPLLRVNSVLMRDNARAFPELALGLASFGIDELSVNQLGGVERPEFHREHALGPGDVEFLEAVWPRLRAELSQRGVRLLGGATYLERLTASARGLALPVADCRPGERFVFVDVDGRMSPCCHTIDSLGSPLTNLEDFRRLPLLFASARAAVRPRACDDCMSTETSAKFERT
ncbi:MAG: radical SAM protein [Polyangiaceae bacterium]